MLKEDRRYSLILPFLVALLAPVTLIALWTVPYPTVGAAAHTEGAVADGVNAVGLGVNSLAAAAATECVLTLTPTYDPVTDALTADVFIGTAVPATLNLWGAVQNGLAWFHGYCTNTPNQLRVERRDHPWSQEISPAIPERLLQSIGDKAADG